MQKFIRRVVWGSVWIATYAIIVYLCMELADGQPVMLALLLLAAFVASVGLVYARQSFRAGDWTVGAAALTVCLFSLAVSVVGDISYWSGTLESVHEQVIRDRAIHEGQTLVMTRQKERYSALASGQSAEQLQAAMAGALARPIGDKTLGARTKDCTDTASYHYRSCTDYLGLKAKFAAASEAQKLESVVWSAGTNVEKPGRRRDFYRAAVWISQMTGWSVENSIYTITAIIVMTLQVLLMLSLYCGSSPSRKEARTASKAPDATETPLKVYPPVQRTARGPVVPWIELPSKSSHAEIPRNSPPHPPKPNYPKFSDSSPDDTPPPGDKAAVAEMEVFIEANKNPLPPQKVISTAEGGKTAPRIVVNNDTPNDTITKHNVSTKPKKKEGCVRTWLEDCSSREPDQHRVRATSKQCYASYQAWCQQRGAYAVSNKKLTTRMAAILRVKDKSRDNAGRVWPGLLVVMPERMRATA